MNVAPFPNSLSHHTLPCIASTIFMTMDRPRPVECSPPVGLELKRKKGKGVSPEWRLV